MLPSSKFEALFKHKFMKSCEMQRIDFTILFQKCSGNQRSIDLYGFYRLMNGLYDVCLKKKGQNAVGDDVFSFIEKLQ